MKTYIFTFNVIPTDNSWWSAYRNETTRVNAANLNEAKNVFYNELAEEYGLNVSAHAKKHCEQNVSGHSNGRSQASRHSI